MSDWPGLALSPFLYTYIHLSTWGVTSWGGVLVNIDHLTPTSKQSPMANTLEFLGVHLRFTDQLRLLAGSKRQEYGAMARSLLKGKELPNGSLTVSRSNLNSLVHKLIPQ